MGQAEHRGPDQQANDLEIRWTNQGKQFPEPLGTVDKVGWIGAGYPDYPWIFGTDAEYTAFAAVSVGQFDAIKEHLTALREISDILNDRSGVVTHEVVADGSIWFGHDSRQNNPRRQHRVRLQHRRDRQVPEHGGAGVAVDGRPRIPGRELQLRRTQPALRRRPARRRSGRWPEGLGNVERTGMGPEKLDNTVYFIRGLFDLADMAKVKHDDATHDWATGLAQSLRQRFDRTWWYQAAAQYADSLNDPGDVQSFQKHWIGQTPMEAELLLPNGRIVPGLAPHGHGDTALAGREDPCYSGEHPLNPGLFHTGCAAAPTARARRSSSG